MIYVFADCVLDTERYVLYQAGHPSQLRPKVFQVLTYLLAQHGRVVSKQELAERVWAEQVVSDTALEACIKAVRRAVGDSGQRQRIIQTRHGHGYCCIVPVTLAALPSEQTAGVGTILSGVAPSQDVAPQLPARSASECKIVTVLCCAPMLALPADERLRLDTLHRQMQGLYSLVCAVAPQYGGHVQPPAGTSVLAVFGAPVAEEDHAQRAVLTAVTLQQRLATSRSAHEMPGMETLPVRMGLHTGRLAMGGIGEDDETATVMVGDITTMAVALQEQAAAGVILCSAATARLVQGAYRLEAMPPLQVPGRSTPVHVYKLRRRSPRRAPRLPRRGWARMPLVGRAQELATLQALWLQVEAGRGQVVGIVGEPGIGKSRFVQAFRRSLRGRSRTYLTGRCLSYGWTIPYLPLVHLLQHACGVRDTDAPATLAVKVHRCLHLVGLAAEAVGPYLLQLLGDQTALQALTGVGPEERRARLFASLLQLSIQGSQRRPLVLEVEDLHWIDATSEAWLAALVDRLAAVPILLLITYRSGYHPPWLDKPYATQIALSRLTPRDSWRVLRAILPAPQVPETLLQELVTKANGNPFFLEQLARSVSEQGEHQATWAVPDTIQAVLTARIDRLSSTAKYVLQLAAVMGKEVRLSLLDALTALPEALLHRSLTELQAAEFLSSSLLVSEPVYTFVHALTQEAAYQSMLRRTRQQYHERLAHLLATQFVDTAASQPELVAQHYTAAECSEPAVRWWQQAGHRALQRAAYVEATHHCTTGLAMLKALPDTPERWRLDLELTSTLGHALRLSKGNAVPEVAQTFTRALELCQQVGEPLHLSSVLGGLRRHYLNRGELQRARRCGEQLFVLAQQTQDPFILQDAHYSLGITHFWLGEGTVARTHLESGIALVDHQQPRSLHWGLLCRVLLAQTLWMLGYPVQALAQAYEAVADARQLSLPVTLLKVLFYAARLHQCLREGPTALAQAEEVIALATEWGLPQWLTSARMLRGWALTEQGQAAAGLAQIHQGWSVYCALGVKPLTILVPLAEVYGKVGQPEEGLRLLDEGLVAVSHNGGHWYEAELYRLRGQLLLAPEGTGQRWEGAEHCFQQALAVARRQQAKAWELRAALSLSRLWQQQGKREEARQLLAGLYGWCTEGFNTADVQEARTLLEAHV